jgi:hypothetical protein
MKLSWALFLVVVGLSLLFGALFYDSLGRPPHVVGMISDEMSAKAEQHHRVARFLFWGGAATIAAGLVLWFVRMASRSTYEKREG